MSYGAVWVVVVLLAGLSAGGWYMLLRPFGSIYVRALVPAAWLALLLLPAPVPGFAGNWAPAFVVLVFEGLFQAAGEPWLAFRLLLAGVCVVVAVVGLIIWILQRHQQPSSSNPP